jgi:alkylhydroperoxidase/carboxymuconolactone decarboxylase family protein YurZ
MVPHSQSPTDLSDRERCLVALGCALATGDEDRVASCTTDCLRARAERADIMEVLRLAVLLAEGPAARCRDAVRRALDAFPASGPPPPDARPP